MKLTTYFQLQPRLMFMDSCIVIQISQKEATRCNRVIEFIIPMFLNCSTCFERHTAHHQELKNCNCSLWFYIRFWLPAVAMAEWELLNAQHVSGDTPPIIRSSKIVIAASGFTYVFGCRPLRWLSGNS